MSQKNTSLPLPKQNYQWIPPTFYDLFTIVACSNRLEFNNQAAGKEVNTKLYKYMKANPQKTNESPTGYFTRIAAPLIKKEIGVGRLADYFRHITGNDIHTANLHTIQILSTVSLETIHAVIQNAIKKETEEHAKNSFAQLLYQPKANFLANTTYNSLLADEQGSCCLLALINQGNFDLTIVPKESNAFDSQTQQNTPLQSEL